MLGDECNQDGGPVLCEHDREVDRVQIRSGVALDLFEEGGVAAAFLAERASTEPSHPADRRLSNRQDRTEENKPDDEARDPHHAMSALGRTLATVVIPHKPTGDSFGH